MAETPQLAEDPARLGDTAFWTHTCAWNLSAGRGGNRRVPANSGSQPSLLGDLQIRERPCFENKAAFLELSRQCATRSLEVTGTPVSMHNWKGSLKTPLLMTALPVKHINLKPHRFYLSSGRLHCEALIKPEITAQGDAQCP